MAQILKDDFRNKIVEAAKIEFLEKGYKGASLRNIADKAGMTVGNLYRYFKNKEDLNRQIVAPTLDKIEKMLVSKTNNQVSFQAHVFNIKMNNSELVKTLDELADEMVEIYDKNKAEFGILMMHSLLNQEIVGWFSNLVKSLINQNYSVASFEIEVNTLANVYAVSIFAGVKHMLLKVEENKENLKSLLKIYFRSYVYMLDTDLSKFLGE